MPENEPFTLPLDSPRADLASAGGKGANLSRMLRAGLPVPGGWILTTAAYRDFTRANRIDDRLRRTFQEPVSQDLSALEELSAAIRDWFQAGDLGPELLASIRVSHAPYLGVPVAVRSSATAEDLPGLSFAGQQETFLNVTGEAALVEAVAGCWSSLWTARAIGYRARNGIPQEGIALAVVVQQLIPSESSGVMFTANPVTGLRSESAIDATLGLGEALVSGQVEPDHYLVDTIQGRITGRRLGAKARVTVARPEGGVATREEQNGACQALPDEQILQLALLGQQAASLFAFPQDLEWAWAGRRLWLLQSRPITSLFPLPEGMSPEPLRVLFSFEAVQGLIAPVTPLGIDFIRNFFAIAAGMFRIRVTYSTQNILYAAGQRLWVNITTPVRNTVGRKAASGLLGAAEPGILQAILSIWDDPRLMPERKGIRLHAARQIAGFALPVAANAILNLLWPEARRKFIVERGERVLREARRRLTRTAGDRRQHLAAILDVFPRLLSENFPKLFVWFISGVVAGVGSLEVLERLAKARGHPDGSREGIWSERVLEVSRGLPNNPTTTMDLALWKVSRAIQTDSEGERAFSTQTPAELAAGFLRGEAAPVIGKEVGAFLAVYGGRGLGEIDLGQPRWGEDPSHIFEVLAGFMNIAEDGQAPDRVFSRSAEKAAQAVQWLAAETAKGRGGWIRARLLRFFAGRARALMGLRENPKFFLVRMLYGFRQELLRVGEEFVSAGELEQKDDLFLLSWAEIRSLSAGEDRDWKALARERREGYRRESLRRQVPRVLLSDGRTFYEGVSGGEEAEGVIAGSPVSPGLVEGQVRVLLHPRDSALQPGEILVCPGTDPSWTPLFLTAGGLVMEVGGVMTHGSVVAREYGIPAVVGVTQATTRLKTGQRVRLDGTHGKIILLD